MDYRYFAHLRGIPWIFLDISHYEICVVRSQDNGCGGGSVRGGGFFNVHPENHPNITRKPKG